MRLLRRLRLTLAYWQPNGTPNGVLSMCRSLIWWQERRCSERRKRVNRACVVNVSAPRYNLGTAKLADWLRQTDWQVDEWAGDPGMFASHYDLVALSVIFSWHALIAARLARQVQRNADVWCGGPGMAALGNWWRQQTGLDCVVGLDQRFERQRGDYRMIFASRGCPVGCWFCIVPRIEGNAFTLDWDFRPAPILADNNLSALPVEFQEHIIRRYQETGMILRDAQSGFEPRTFDEGTYRRWKPVLRGPWRFAFDSQDEAGPVNHMMRLLAGESVKRKQVYVLIGNESMESCYERVLRVIEWGGEPFCQPFVTLNSLDGRPKPRHDWTEQRLRSFARYVNRHLWRYLPLAEYRLRKSEPPPFVGLRWAEIQAKAAMQREEEACKR